MEQFQRWLIESQPWSAPTDPWGFDTVWVAIRFCMWRAENGYPQYSTYKRMLDTVRKLAVAAARLGMLKMTVVERRYYWYPVMLAPP
jgi:hypothetical protein